jgi:hypothetical protein
MAKYAQSQYRIKNPEKYMGNKTPFFRSSWEFAFMRFCDEHPNVTKWASEAIRIPYRNPFTGKYTVYVPDFLIVYIDKDQQRHAEVIEIKPSKETTMETAKTTRDKAAVVLNMAKWTAARAFCQQHGLVFRVVNEQDIYHGTKRR